MTSVISYKQKYHRATFTLKNKRQPTFTHCNIINSYISQFKYLGKRSITRVLCSKFQTSGSFVEMFVYHYSIKSVLKSSRHTTCSIKI